jgi:hypothetical protein
VTLYAGETVSTGRRVYVITGVQNDPAAGSVTFELNQALPVRDLHKSVPFTIGS